MIITTNSAQNTNKLMDYELIGTEKVKIIEKILINNGFVCETDESVKKFHYFLYNNITY